MDVGEIDSFLTEIAPKPLSTWRARNLVKQKESVMKEASDLKKELVWSVWKWDKILLCKIYLSN